MIFASVALLWCITSRVSEHVCGCAVCHMPQSHLKEDNVKTRNTDCDKNVFDEEIKS